MPSKTYTFCILEKQKRVDITLTALFPTLSRSYIQHSIEQGDILINQKVCKVSHFPLKKKDIIQFTIPSLEKSGIIPSDLPLDILYEDTDIMVLNKPPFVVVHPSDNGGHIADSMVSRLLYHVKDLQGIKGNMRPGMVHRLDKDTSGILVIAKNDEALHHLSKQWQDRTVYKEYIALLAGKLEPKFGAIEAPLGRSNQDRKKQAVKNDDQARYAKTEYEVLEYFQSTTLVKIHILTGRTHQIRVHMAAIGHPVVGDETYGNKKINEVFTNQGLKRQFLHASFLKFQHPKTNKIMEIHCPLPYDLQKIIEN